MRDISGWRVLFHRKICHIDYLGSVSKRLEVIFSDEQECRRLFGTLSTSPEILTVELQHNGLVVGRMDLVAHEV